MVTTIATVVAGAAGAPRGGHQRRLRQDDEEKAATVTTAVALAVAAAVRAPVSSKPQTRLPLETLPIRKTGAIFNTDELLHGRGAGVATKCAQGPRGARGVALAGRLPPPLALPLVLLCNRPWRAAGFGEWRGPLRLAGCAQAALTTPQPAAAAARLALLLVEGVCQRSNVPTY